MEALNAHDRISVSGDDEAVVQKVRNMIRNWTMPDQSGDFFANRVPILWLKGGSRRVNDLVFRTTCLSNPEQYDVHAVRDGFTREQVGYVRLRRGRLTVHAPTHDGPQLAKGWLCPQDSGFDYGAFRNDAERRMALLLCAALITKARKGPNWNYMRHAAAGACLQRAWEFLREADAPLVVGATLESVLAEAGEELDNAMTCLAAPASHKEDFG